MDNQPLPLGEWDGLAGFDLQQFPDQYFCPFDGDGKLVGLSCHHACYRLLLDRLKYKLKMSDVQALQAGREWEAHLMDGDYGGILQYQDQVNDIGCFFTYHLSAFVSQLVHLPVVPLQAIGRGRQPVDD